MHIAGAIHVELADVAAAGEAVGLDAETARFVVHLRTESELAAVVDGDGSIDPVAIGATVLDFHGCLHLRYFHSRVRFPSDIYRITGRLDIPPANRTIHIYNTNADRMPIGCR